jgi:hypothetical protein
VIPTGLTPDSYRFQAEDLERHHGPLLPTPEELHDLRLISEDRTADYRPARAAGLLDDTDATAHMTGPLSVPAAPPSSCDGGGGQGPTPGA